jgi:hypothetical protein
MTANYPNGLPILPSQQIDGTSTVDAADVNPVYLELAAVASTVGTLPANRVDAWNASGETFNTSFPGSFTTVKDRIKNVENGTFIITNSAITTSGGRTILPSGTSTVNLSLRAQTSQTANLLELRNASNTIVTRVTSSGHIAVIDGGDA